MKTIRKVIHGDSRQMNLVTDESVHLIITSPPYWQLKDYGTSDQIGYHETYENYINNLSLVWKECHRALHSERPQQTFHGKRTMAKGQDQI